MAEAEEVGTASRSHGEGQHLDPAWATSEDVQEPTEGEYYRALEKGLATTAEQERILASESGGPAPNNRLQRTGYARR